MTIVRDAELSSGFVAIAPLSGLTAVTHCGEAVTTRQHVRPSHQHLGFEFMFACRGRYRWTVAGRTVTQTVGDLLVVHPDQWHRTAPGLRSSCHLLWVGVRLSELGEEGERLAAALRAYDRQLVPQIPQVEPLLRGVLQQATGTGPDQVEVARGYLRTFAMVTAQRLAGLQSANLVPPRNRITVPVISALQLARDHLDGPLPLTRFATVAGVSPSQLCRLFADEVGCSPVQYHRQLRLDAAKARLLDPEASIASTAAEFGFSSSQHLSTLFRGAFGLTPRQWQVSIGSDKSNA